MALTKIYTDLDLTFKKTGRNDVRKKVDADAINQHLRILMLTEQDDIPFLNNVSADLRNLLFMPYTPHIQNTINELVENIISQFEKRIIIDSVVNTNTANDLTITVNYTIKQTRIVGQFKTILKRVS